VAADSQTATYAALKLYVDNWRWQGVPFYLRSGKALAAKNSEIALVFKRPPHLMFSQIEDEDFSADVLSLCIQPDEGLHWQFEAKVPGTHEETRPVDMEFHYRTSFEDVPLPDAYQRLLLDALAGDATLFARRDEIEAAWELIDSILASWQSADVSPLLNYERGSWGPEAADTLLEQDGRHWRHNCGQH
jgi:glucose-6-phosphate 1-dehydrogenase